MPGHSSHERHFSGLSRWGGAGARPVALGRPMVLNDCNPNQVGLTLLPSCPLCHSRPPYRRLVLWTAAAVDRVLEQCAIGTQSGLPARACLVCLHDASHHHPDSFSHMAAASAAVLHRT